MDFVLYEVLCRGIDVHIFSRETIEVRAWLKRRTIERQLRRSRNRSEIPSFQAKYVRSRCRELSCEGDVERCTCVPRSVFLSVP